MVATQTRVNPFPGLRPFNFDENRLFFGREGQIDELLRRLRRTHFLAVVGTSGSGKSSLVRAGLLPALYSGVMTQAGSTWRMAVMRPGNAPIANLAHVLSQPDVLLADAEDATIQTLIVEATLQRGALGLVEVVQQARLPQNENLLIVVDQFEELFRFKQQTQSNSASEEATAFVKLILEAIRQTELPIYVVLTMRSDFLGDCAQFRDLPEAINDSQYLIPRMTREQQRSAIAGPVAVGGAEITPRLVNRLLNDVGDNPDQLPILQHALMRTWDNWVADHAPGEPIDLRHYEAIGGMARGLSQHADEIYATLSDPQKKIVEKLFKRLTEKAADGQGIRRPTQLSEIGAIAGATLLEVTAVVERFRAPGCSFLMPPVGVPLTNVSVLDISHESLMRVWEKLETWVNQEVQSAQIYHRLAETAMMHQEEKAGLLNDPELTIALTWRRLVNPNADWAQRYHPAFESAMIFLDASVVAQEAAIAAQEAVRHREINRLRGFSAVVFILLLLALGTAAIALQQSQIASTQKQEAELQKQEADRQRQRAEYQRTIARRGEQEARNARASAQYRQRLAESARRSEAQQRAQAIAALGRAERGEREAQRQTELATEQRTIAVQQRQAAQVAEANAQRQEALAIRQTINTQINFQSLAAENLLTSGFDLDALLASLEVVQQIKQQNSLLNPSTQMRAIATLRQVVYGITERNRWIGHSAPISSVSFSPDGQTIASASEDQTVGLWTLSGQLLVTCKGHTNIVRAVVFSPDGETIASASDDSTVKLWNRQGQLLHTLQGHKSFVSSVAFSPDSETIASAGSDNTIKLWNRQGQLLQTLEGHSNEVRSVAFSPDGETIASASDDYTIKLWSREGQLLQTLKGHNGQVNSVAFSPDGQTLVSGSSDNTIKLWRLNGRLLQTLRGHTDVVRYVAFSPDGQTIASASNDFTVKLWSREGQLLRTLTHGDFALSVNFSPDGRLIVTSSGDNTIRLWQREEPPLQRLTVNSSSLDSRFSPDGQIIAAAVSDGTVQIWNRRGEPLATLRGHQGEVSGVNFSPDSQTIASAGQDKTVRLWNRQGKLLATLEGHEDSVLDVSFSPDGETIASASADTTVSLWSRQGQLLHTLQGHEGIVWSVAFSPDGETIASASADDTIKLWNRQGQLLQTLEGHSDEVNRVAFSADSQILASVSDDGTVKLWNRQGELLTTLRGHQGLVWSVDFSPNGQTLVTASSDQTVRLWSREGELLSILRGHTERVFSASFSPDGQTIASSSADQSVILWNLNPTDLLAQGCTWARDYLLTNPEIQSDARQLCGVEQSETTSNQPVEDHWAMALLHRVFPFLTRE